MSRKLTEIEQAIKKSLKHTQIPTWANVKIYPGYEEKVYQQPERDEQGTFYGYKVLVFTEGKFYSPRFPVLWNPDGSLDSDREPTSHNRHGIYSVKRINDSEIYYYLKEFPGMYRYSGFVSVIVRLAISGTVIEHETGFRSQSAQILEVFENGHRYSYQEVYERSQGYPRRDTKEEPPYYSRWFEGNW